jgi:hypothetical protein
MNNQILGYNYEIQVRDYIISMNKMAYLWSHTPENILIEHNIIGSHNLIACPVSICDNMKSRKKYIEVLEKRADSLIEYNSLMSLINYIYERIMKTYTTFISTC